MITPLRELPGVRDHVASTVRTVLSRPGQPLRADLRADLEPRFGADFSTVRVHADETAHASARQLNANAYTVGQHIVFGQDRFAPQTVRGRALLAHELTHTIQQGQATGVPHGTTSSGGPAEDAARHAGAQAMPGAAPAIARRPPAGPPGPAAIARDEGTAEVVDVVTQFQQRGSVFSAKMQRDQYRTHAEAQQARAGQTPPKMDTGFANVSLDTSTGALTVPLTVTARGVTPADTQLDSTPPKNPSYAISAARVNAVADQFIAECNRGLNNWFTLYVPPCPGVLFAGRELPITVKVTKGSAANADFTVVVSPDQGRSFVLRDAHTVLLYAGDLGPMALRHEGSHVALGVPDEYLEPDPEERRRWPVQKGEQRVRHDFPLPGDYADWGILSMLRERHFSFVPVFVQKVLTSLGHPECVPVLHEVAQPRLLRLSAGYGVSSYGGLSLHVEAGADVGRFLDREREWRGFLGVHGHAFVASTQPNAYLVGARLGFEHKWRSSRLGPTAEAFAESGAAFETGAGGRRPAVFVGGGASLGASWWSGGKEWQLKLTGGEVLRLDREGYHAFQAGFLAGLSW